jgi:hypothetical protein
MPDFFYQIKARQESDSEWNRWIWPPVFSGKVQAADKKQARALVDAEYGQKFPMRVLAKDIETAPGHKKWRPVITSTAGNSTGLTRWALWPQFTTPPRPKVLPAAMPLLEGAAS